MNANLTEMVFILDRSGSMESLTEETIGGFNSLVAKQRAASGEAEVTTILFDDQYEVLHDHVPIRKISRLTEKEYYARGCTALLDAIGLTIDRIGNRLDQTPEAERPGKVIVAVTTDGYENASSRYSKSKIQEMIRRQTDVYKWQFLFLGANMDAVSEADSLGIRPCMAATYTPGRTGIRSVFGAIGRMIDVMRLSDCDFDDDEFLDECEEIMSSVK